MPRKQEEKPRVEVKAWDLNIPEVREKLRKFQGELQKIALDPEKRMYAFDWWCVAKGYYKRAEIKEYISPVDGKTYKRPENYAVIPDISLVWEMKKALDSLLEREAYAKKQQHLSDLGGHECMGKPGSKNRCLICYPKTVKEILGKSYTNLFRPKAPVEHAVRLQPDPEHGLVAVDDFSGEGFTFAEKPTEEKKTSKKDNWVDGICTKCSNPVEECECIDLSDIPF